VPLLIQLQNALTALVVSPGHIPFYTFRAFKNLVREELEPFRSIDGELVEKFLELDEEVQENIATWLKDEHVKLDKSTGKEVDTESLRKLVEGLKRLR
jgi:DNA damage-binding protein 1